MSYNYWIEDLLGRVDRRRAEVTFDPHLFDRSEYRSLDLGMVEETVRTGRVVAGKCEAPGKLCFSRYFGKENLTCTVIAIFHQSFIEVRTVWQRKGR